MQTCTMGKGLSRNLGLLRHKGPWGVAKPPGKPALSVAP
jgi:hypothetical protein